MGNVQETGSLIVFVRKYNTHTLTHFLLFFNLWEHRHKYAMSARILAWLSVKHHLDVCCYSLAADNYTGTLLGVRWKAGFWGGQIRSECR